MSIEDDVRCECDGELVNNNHDGLGPMLGWKGPGPHSVLCKFRSDKYASEIRGCVEYVHILGKDITDQYCVKCECDNCNLWNGQCVYNEDLQIKQVCDVMLPGKNCENCYQYQGPLVDGSDGKFTCG